MRPAAFVDVAHIFLFFEGMKMLTGCAGLFLICGVARGPGLGLNPFLASAVAESSAIGRAGEENTGFGGDSAMFLGGCKIGVAGLSAGAGGDVVLAFGDWKDVAAGCGAEDGSEVAEVAFALPPVRARSLSSLFSCSALTTSSAAFC